MPTATPGPARRVAWVVLGAGGVSHFVRQGVGHNDHNDHPELRPPLRRGELYPATVIKSRAVARKSAEKCKKKVPKIKERLFSAFLCGHYSGISGLVSTKTMPDLNVPLDSAGIGPKTRIDVDIQGGNRVMKISKQFLIAGAILCAITTTGAHAVTKCVALDSSSTMCTSDETQYLGHTDWAATCTTNGVSTPISGIGICSSFYPTSQYDTRVTQLNTSSTVDENLNCWCRMISPAVSHWVFRNSLTSAGICAQACAYQCAESIKTSPPFRYGLFGSLSD